MVTSAEKLSSQAEQLSDSISFFRCCKEPKFNFGTEVAGSVRDVSLFKKPSSLISKVKEFKTFIDNGKQEEKFKRVGNDIFDSQLRQFQKERMTSV